MKYKEFNLSYSSTSKIINGLLLLYKKIAAMNQDVLIDDTSRLIRATNDELDQIDSLLAQLEEFRSKFKSDDEEPNQEPD